LAEPPRDMFFQDYGVNPWVDAWDDNRSTFGLDVDTGSFTLARKYLAEGNLPPREAVRVEEFVNALEQGYAAPWRETFAIHLDGAPSPFGREGERLVRVGVQGRDVGDWRRKDAVLTFVIDVSGSMDIDGRLEGVKDALKGLVGALGPGDAIGIVAYTDEAWVALPTTPAGDPRPILAAIAELAPLSSTNVEAGLALGYDVAEAAFRADAINRVILCSDGVANVGATDPAAILERVGRSVGRGITLTTVGVGMGNYNDVIMEQLADQGDGAYAYVDGPAEAERLFREDLVGTLQLIARDAKVQVEFNPETVWAYRLIGYENRDIDDRDFTDDRVDAGEVGAGHGVTALYAVALPPGARGEIATVTLRYRDAAEGDVREQDAVLRTGDLAADFDRADPRFRLTVAVATFAEILGASRHVAGVRWDDLLAVAESAAGDLDDARSREALDLMTRASRLGLAYER